jgi:hypothetical protein
MSIYPSQALYNCHSSNPQNESTRKALWPVLQMTKQGLGRLSPHPKAKSAQLARAQARSPERADVRARALCSPQCPSLQPFHWLEGSHGAGILYSGHNLPELLLKQIHWINLKWSMVTSEFVTSLPVVLVIRNPVPKPVLYSFNIFLPL